MEQRCLVAAKSALKITLTTALLPCRLATGHVTSQPAQTWRPAPGLAKRLLERIPGAWQPEASTATSSMQHSKPTGAGGAAVAAGWGAVAASRLPLPQVARNTPPVRRHWRGGSGGWARGYASEDARAARGQPG